VTSSGLESQLLGTRLEKERNQNIEASVGNVQKPRKFREPFILSACFLFVSFVLFLKRTGITLNHEEPELERKKSELLREEETCKVQLADLEQQLLRSLASSTGDLLENKGLTDSLEKTKIQANNIQKSLDHGREVRMNKSDFHDKEKQEHAKKGDRGHER
jgi:hypothetical protein